MEYSGDINSKDAFEILANVENSLLVDVRTDDEWKFIGETDLSSIDKESIKISWIFIPEMNLNKNFIQDLAEQVDDKNSRLLFLCKSGGRSKEAAIAAFASGYKYCYNIEDGFEGNKNLSVLSKSSNGWKENSLPWKRG